MSEMGRTLALAASAGHVAAMSVKSVPDGVVHGFNGGARVGNKAGQFVGWVISKPAGALKKRKLLKESGTKELSKSQQKALADYKARVSRPFKKLGAGLFGAVATIPGAVISTPLKFLYNFGKGLYHLPTNVRELRERGDSPTILDDLGLPDNAFTEISDNADYVSEGKVPHKLAHLTGTKEVFRNIDNGSVYTEYKMFETKGKGWRSRKQKVCDVCVLEADVEGRSRGQTTQVFGGLHRGGAWDAYTHSDCSKITSHDKALRSTLYNNFMIDTD